jgi:hypothetical protein
MEKLIFKSHSSIDEFINRYSVDETRYIWMFVKGCLYNKYCEIGIACNEKEVDAKEYNRQLCLLNIEEMNEEIILKNKSIITFSEPESFWGTPNYIIASCNGSTLWQPIIYSHAISSGFIFWFDRGKISFEFDKKCLTEIKNKVYEFSKYKKINFLDELLK